MDEGHEQEGRGVVVRMGIDGASKGRTSRKRRKERERCVACEMRNGHRRRKCVKREGSSRRLEDTMGGG